MPHANSLPETYSAAQAKKYALPARSPPGCAVSGPTQIVDRPTASDCLRRLSCKRKTRCPEHVPRNRPATVPKSSRILCRGELNDNAVPLGCPFTVNSGPFCAGQKDMYRNIAGSSLGTAAVHAGSIRQQSLARLLVRNHSDIADRQRPAGILRSFQTGTTDLFSKARRARRRIDFFAAEEPAPDRNNSAHRRRCCAGTRKPTRVPRLSRIASLR